MMQVVAMLGGLASQMCKYALFYGISKNDNEMQCCIDTTAYHYKTMWNGYELEKVFGIRALDLYDLYDEKIKENSLSFLFLELQW